MGHQPLFVDGVAGKSAAQLIVNAASGHAVAGFQDRLGGVIFMEAAGVPEEVQGNAGPGKFWRTAKATMLGVKFMEVGLAGSVQFPLSGGKCVFGIEGCCGPKAFSNICCGSDEVGLLRFPEFDNALQQLPKAHPSVFGRGWEIRAAVKRLEFGCQENVQGPAAGAGGGLNETHVNLVDIGSFLPVDLDIDEMLVEVCGCGFILERLAFHHMAPMASGIANAQEDRFVLAPRQSQGFVSPRVPLDRIMGMLEEIG